MRKLNNKQIALLKPFFGKAYMVEQLPETVVNAVEKLNVYEDMDRDIERLLQDNN